MIEQEISETLPAYEKPTVISFKETDLEAAVEALGTPLGGGPSGSH